MSRGGARGLIAGATFLGSVGAMLVLATPAKACSCGRPDIEAALTAGHTLAIVTRTDRAGNATAEGKAPVATFRVEDSAGPEPPAELRGTMDTGASCQPYVAPGALAALIFQREDEGWRLEACAEADFGRALERVQGRPAAVAGGKPIAYAAGAFGGSRVVAVDRAGETVAYDGRPGLAEQVAVCPGGRTVVAFGRTDAVDYGARVAQLTVHDAADLRVRRTVVLPLVPYEHILALRCRDGEGRTADVLLVNSADGPGRLLTVDGTELSGHDLGNVTAGAAVADGFVATVGDRAAGPSLVRIRPGAKEEVTPLGAVDVEGSLAVSPDERTAAVSGYGTDGDASLVTVDLASGARLGEWSAAETYVTGLAWVGPDRLLVRHEEHYRETPIRLRAFDRTLAQAADRPSAGGEWGGALTAVGGVAVVYGRGSRLTAVPESGTPLVADSLRLAAAEHLAAVPGAVFAAGPADPAAGPADPAAADAVPAGASERFTYVGPDVGRDGGSALVVGLVGGVAGAALLGAAVLAVRRRRT